MGQDALTEVLASTSQWNAGDYARVGGGAVVVKDVPAHSTAIGVPARVVVTRDPATGTTRRIEQLPDPEGVMLKSLHDKVVELETRIVELEDELAGHHHEHHSMPESLFAALTTASEDPAYDGGPGWGI